jgi:hypothetical protein
MAGGVGDRAPGDAWPAAVGRVVERADEFGQLLLVAFGVGCQRA